MDILKCILEVVSVIAIYMAVGVAWRQLGMMKKTLQADHDRRKKQATFEFYHNISNEKDAALQEIKHRKTKNETINVCDVKSDPILKEAIKKYLTRMERISVGVNHDIYDISIFNDLLGGDSIRWFDKLKDVIDDFRRDSDQHGRSKTYLYKDFEEVVSKLKKMRSLS